MPVSEPTIPVPSTLLGPSGSSNEEQLREIRETWGCGIERLGEFLCANGVDGELVNDRLVKGVCDAAEQAADLKGELPLMASQVLVSQTQAYALLDLAQQYGIPRREACDVLWDSMMGFRGVQEALGLASLNI